MGKGLETKADRCCRDACWLCLEGDDHGPLVQPCACNRPLKWVHRHCLTSWRRTREKTDAAYRCGQCMDHYCDALSLELLSARLQAERTDGQSTITTLATFASELKAQGKYTEAEPLLREALEKTRETLGNRHPHTITSLGNLGALLQAKGNLAAAEPLLREALEGLRETLGSRHPDALACIHNLGLLFVAKGDGNAAKTLLYEALEVAMESLESRHFIYHEAVHEALEVAMESFQSRHSNTRAFRRLRLSGALVEDLNPSATSTCHAQRTTLGPMGSIARGVPFRRRVRVAVSVPLA